MGICGRVEEDFAAFEDDGGCSFEQLGGSSVVEGEFDCTEADAVGEREAASNSDARVESREAGAVILKTGPFASYMPGLNCTNLLQ